MKYPTFIFLIFFGIVNAVSVAQNDKDNVDELVSEFINSLESRAIGEYFSLKKYCLGTTEIFKLKDGSMCVSKGTYYQVFVFWKEEDQAMIKKIDNCGMYFSLPLSNTEVMDFLDINRKQLKEGVVKKYEVENPENVPAKSSKIHSCFREFQFNNENNSFGQSYNLYDLTNESKYKNINFESNNKLKIVALEKMLESLILQMESKFRRQF
ncbi:MAG: hypothetical protein COB12_01340 [Flavobacterium sp.]|nr:MAG: hypothetical protein COB12_01340 [Flavobacterium sp.]